MVLSKARIVICCIVMEYILSQQGMGKAFFGLYQLFPILILLLLKHGFSPFIVEMEEIPQLLIINWDHTGITAGVEVAGHNNKNQITAVFTATMSGKLLPPMQALKTIRCLPSVSFPVDWNVTFIENTFELYINSILISYLQEERRIVIKSWSPSIVFF